MFEGPPKSADREVNESNKASKFGRLLKTATLIGGLATGGYLANEKINDHSETKVKPEHVGKSPEENPEELTLTKRAIRVVRFKYDSAGDVIDTDYGLGMFWGVNTVLERLTDGDMEALTKKVNAMESKRQGVMPALFVFSGQGLLSGMSVYEDLVSMPQYHKQAEFVLAKIRKQSQVLQEAWPGIVDVSKLPDYLK